MQIKIIMFIAGVFLGCLQTKLLIVTTCSLVLLLLKPKEIFIYFVIGFSWYYGFYYYQKQHQIPVAIENKKISIEGTIANVPSVQDKNTRFLFNSHYGIVQLSWFGLSHQLHMGDHWRFILKLKRIHGFHNPGSFNRERDSLVKKIRGRGYVLQGERLSQGHSLRESIKNKINQSLDGRAFAGIITALTVGLQDDIVHPQWEIFRKTGTPHLVAISGLHVGLVTGLMIALLTLFNCAPKIRVVCGFLAALFYSVLAGMSLPTQRALIMIALYSLNKLTARNASLFSIFISTVFLVLVYNPLSPWSASFWLSFLAVGFLIYGLQHNVGTKFYGVLKPQWVASLALFPVSLWVFHQVSVVGVIANVVAIPWVSLIVVPLDLLALISYFVWPGLATYMWQLVHLSIEPLWWILTWLAALPCSVWQHGIIHPWILMCAMLGVIIVLHPKKTKLKFLGLFLLLPIFIVKTPRPKPGEYTVNIFDVGQGLSVLVRTASHTLLFDTGPSFGRSFSAGDAVIVPYHYKYNINTLDTLVISHGDDDHRGGANSVLSHIKVNAILTSQPSKLKPYKATRCKQGQQWQWDGVTFEMLYPFKKKYKSSNNNSCVLKISNHHKSILLTGDIEKPAEKDLVKHYGSQLKSNNLIAPHHGSKSSSTIPFIKAVSPDEVIFSTGYLNRFHFPRTSIIQRYKSLNIKTRNTAKEGMIEYHILK